MKMQYKDLGRLESVGVGVYITITFIQPVNTPTID